MAGKNIGASRHSRAARRATSPSLNLDKSLKNAKPPAEGANHQPAILALHHAAGVSKKSKKHGPLSQQKRKRREKGAAKAELALDKLELKIAKSVGRGKTIKGRRAAWEELNAKILSTATGAKPRIADREVVKDDGDLERMSVEGGDSATRAEKTEEPKDIQGVEAIHLARERAEEEEEEL